MLHGIFIHLLNLLLCSLSQEAILDIKRIRVSYLRTWFIPDVIAAFPIGYILLFAVITAVEAANSRLEWFRIRNLTVAVTSKIKQETPVITEHLYFIIPGLTVPQRRQSLQDQQNDEDTDVCADPQLDQTRSSVQTGQILQ